MGFNLGASVDLPCSELKRWFGGKLKRRTDILESMTRNSSALLLLLLSSEGAHGSAVTAAPTPLAMKTAVGLVPAVVLVPASGLDVTGGACHEQCYFESPTGCANQRPPQG